MRALNPLQMMPDEPNWRNFDKHLGRFGLGLGLEDLPSSNPPSQSFLPPDPTHPRNTPSWGPWVFLTPLGTSEPSGGPLGIL